MLVDFDNTNVDPERIVSKHIHEKFFLRPLTTVSWKGRILRFWACKSIEIMFDTGMAASRKLQATSLGCTKISSRLINNCRKNHLQLSTLDIAQS
jgi:hypothetical protein